MNLIFELIFHLDDLAIGYKSFFVLCYFIQHISGHEVKNFVHSCVHTLQHACEYKMKFLLKYRNKPFSLRMYMNTGFLFATFGGTNEWE